MVQNAKKNSSDSLVKTWPFGDNSWTQTESEGKLAVDVIETDAHIIIITTIAGARFEDIDVSVHSDVATIRGRRDLPVLPEGNKEFIHTECFWGPFSRTIVLPNEVKAEQARAEYKNGVLTVTIPKRKVDAKIRIKIIEE